MITRSSQVLVPLVTPLTQKGTVCGESLQRLIHSCQPYVDGFIPCLTSGEGWCLSDTQWSEMVAATLALVGDQHRVIVGIERPSTDEVLKRAAHARALGATAIMVTSPFGPGVNQADIVTHYRAIHDQTDLELLIYNESSLPGNEKDMDTLLCLAQFERITALKDSPSLSRTQAQIDQIQAAGADYLLGWEHQLAGELHGDGHIVALANLEPAVCRLACTARQPELATLIIRLNSRFGLDKKDWYAHVKHELALRGVLNNPVTVQELNS